MLTADEFALMGECLRLFKVLREPIIAVARECGYALGLHGSLIRDIDLIAVPWTDEATDPAALVWRIIATVKEHNRGIAFLTPHEEWPRVKPHGRLCWSIHLGGGPYIDLSITPLNPATLGREQPPAPPAVLQFQCAGCGTYMTASQEIYACAACGSPRVEQV